MDQCHTKSDAGVMDVGPVSSHCPPGTKTKRVAILQSNYIPWKGYFDLINRVDEFILYDDMQYTRRDWRNRNKIKTQQGLLWLSIPVQAKGNYHQSIKDTMVSDPNWCVEHWKTIKHNYARAKWFSKYAEILEELYRATNERRLSKINHRFLTAMCSLLGIATRITWSMDYRLADGKTERLVELCKQAGATEYISGPAAKDYIEADLFAEEQIALRWMDYSGYAEYEQLHGPFEHQVSIIDLIMNEGPDAGKYMKSF